jgi:hypothetical protein
MEMVKKDKLTGKLKHARLLRCCCELSESSLHWLPNPLTGMKTPKQLAMARFLTSLLFLSGLLSCDAQESRQADTAVLPSVTAFHSASPVMVDGFLNEPVWQSAQKLRLRENSEGVGVMDSTRETIVRIVYDETNLYIAFECKDTDIWGHYRNRDEHLWKEEAVEVFLDVDDTAETYIEIEVSPNNVLFDSFIVDTLDIDVAATAEYDLSGIRTAVRVDGTVNEHRDVDRRWLVEIAMPLAEMVTDFDAAMLTRFRWRINFYRIDRSPAGESSFYAWSPTGGRFHRPSLFGTLQFARP